MQNITGSGIEKEGAEELSKALMVNSTLTYLGLGCDDKNSSLFMISVTELV